MGSLPLGQRIGSYERRQGKALKAARRIMAEIAFEPTMNCRDAAAEECSSLLVFGATGRHAFLRGGQTWAS